MNQLIGNGVRNKVENNFKLSIIFLFQYLFLDGLTLPVNLRQKIYSNGTLTIDQVQRQTDAGTYTCQAKNHHGHSSRRDVEIQVLSINYIT